MKKSDIYYLLQMMVLRNEDPLTEETRIEILRELFVQEDLAKITEKQETVVNGK